MPPSSILDAAPGQDPALPNAPARRFVIHKHWARQLHYDFRLELNGTLKSWAVPKGPSLDPSLKRLAIAVPDHALSYADFEGVIDEGQYGAGRVIVWDRGCWLPTGDPVAGHAAGKLSFRLQGVKLNGGWTLLRMQPRRGAKRSAAAVGPEPAWLLIKENDQAARASASFDVLVEQPDSVLRG